MLVNQRHQGKPIVLGTGCAAQIGKMLAEKMADTVGFEPTKELPLYTLSRRAPSTTRPRVRLFWPIASLREAWFLLAYRFAALGRISPLSFRGGGWGWGLSTGYKTSKTPLTPHIVLARLAAIYHFRKSA